MTRAYDRPSTSRSSKGSPTSGENKADRGKVENIIIATKIEIGCPSTSGALISRAPGDLFLYAHPLEPQLARTLIAQASKAQSFMCLYLYVNILYTRLC